MNAMTFEQNDLFSTFNQDLGSIRGLTQEEIELIAGAFDWGGLGNAVLSGAVGGAVGGAVAGSMAGGAGAVPGALAGGVGGAIAGGVTFAVGAMM